MIEKIVLPKNLYKAYRQVYSNKGSAGVDGMKLEELKDVIDSRRTDIITSILNNKYIPQPIKGIVIPKSNEERNKPER